MIKPGGFNPMRWDCERDGCFNLKRRPKIEAFADCFPGRINFGDVDGLVEFGGNFCLLEWKGAGGRLRDGQRRSYETFTKGNGNIVFVVYGNAETMKVEGYSVFWQGCNVKYREADIETVKAGIRKWVRRGTDGANGQERYLADGRTTGADSIAASR